MRIAILVLSLLFVTGAAPAAEPHKIVVLAHLNKNDAADNPTGAMAIAFKRQLETLSNDTIRVDIFPEGQLGGDDQTVALTRKGVIQSAISSVGGMAGIYPLIGVLDFPFAYRTLEDTYRVFDGPFGRRLAGDIERKTGLSVIGYGDQGGFFVLTNSRRPVRNPSDMVGLRVRTMGIETHKTFVRSLGAEPVGMAWRDLFGALQSRVVDGQMNPVSIVKFARFDEAQKYLTITNHIFTPYIWTMNAAFYGSLTAKEQAWVAEAAKAGVAASRTVARAMVESERGLPALAQRMEVYRPTPAERDAFRNAAQPAVRALIAEKFGQEGIDMLVAFLDAIAPTVE